MWLVFLLSEFFMRRGEDIEKQALFIALLNSSAPPEPSLALPVLTAQLAPRELLRLSCL